MAPERSESMEFDLGVSKNQQVVCRAVCRLYSANKVRNDTTPHRKITSLAGSSQLRVLISEHVSQIESLAPSRIMKDVDSTDSFFVMHMREYWSSKASRWNVGRAHSLMLEHEARRVRPSDPAELALRHGKSLVSAADRTCSREPQEPSSSSRADGYSRLRFGSDPGARLFYSYSELI